MCTVTWARQNDGYFLLCNRDERNSRQPALGPQVNELRGVKYIAPIDGDYGGSWIGVNQFGLSLCLLNRYGEMALEETRKYISRGLLLIDLLDCRRTQQVIARIEDFDLTRFRPFNMLAMTRESEPVLFEWTGSKYSMNADAEVPLTSTSLTSPGIAIERTTQFRSLTSGDPPTVALLNQFHRSHVPTRGPSSVCMHRDGAKTVSLSRVSVTANDIVFEYEPGSPCESTLVQRVAIQVNN